MRESKEGKSWMKERKSEKIMKISNWRKKRTTLRKKERNRRGDIKTV